MTATVGDWSLFAALALALATLKVLVRPLLPWIWIGGGVIVLGTLVALWPFRSREPREA